MCSSKGISELPSCVTLVKQVLHLSHMSHSRLGDALLANNPQISVTQRDRGRFLAHALCLPSF